MKSSVLPPHIPALENSSANASANLGDLPIWDLSDLYPEPDGKEQKEDLKKLEQLTAEYADSFEGKIAELEAPELARAIEDYEKIDMIMGRLGSFAYLRYAQNTQDAERVKDLSNIQEELTNLSTRLIFFRLEINRIDDDRYEALIAGHKGLQRYRPVLDRLRALKPYQLSDELEKFLHDQSVTGDAWSRLFDETISGLSFELDGEQLGIEATLDKLSSTDRSLREKAARALAKTFAENIKTFARVHNTQIKDKEIVDRWRGMPSAETSRHLSNHVEPEVVEALRQAVTSAYPRISHRYYKLKARWMGLEKLEIWDRNAPLPDQDERVIHWTEARRIVEEAYHGFDPKMAELSMPFFEKGWIDAPVREGKSPGAFAHPTVSDAHPYVMLNYLGKPRDVMTLAHELGHGVHQRLASSQGELLSSTPLTLAETASVFGEMLTFRKLLSEAPDTRTRKALLASKVEDMINTLVRQIAFYEFERRLHAARKKSEQTPKEIGEIWMSVQRESLGDAFNYMEGYEHFWAYIPHFVHSPFYVYAYAFGDGLVNALYAVYEEGDPGFAERYFEMLSAGGSKHHKELLAPFGLDASDPAFWQRGLTMIENMIIELEETD